MPTPFVQGCLTGEALGASIRTECAHCGRSLHLEMNELGQPSVLESDAAPLLFEPEIDWETFRKPNIIDDF